MARNSAPQPLALEEVPVQRIRQTVSATQHSTPATFDVETSSFSNFSHFPGAPPLFAKQAVHSFFVAATPAAMAGVVCGRGRAPDPCYLGHRCRVA
mmetsp:Transcript_116544/g.370685  ORF Transcript_116544/g.370685 Transcript_116544/m.370685 type:complete len:96 (-) Transcript_116544:23-310(-)